MNQIAPSNRQKLLNLLEAIYTADSEAIKIVDPCKYIEHNLGYADGPRGLEALFMAVPRGTARLETVRVFEDGDFVFAHTDYGVFRPLIGFDIYRFENRRIVEHWNNLQPKSGPNPSGHSMIDGPNIATDLDRTQANKVLVGAFVEDILIGGRMEKLAAFVDGERYTQHHPQIADGFSNFAARLTATSDAGIAFDYRAIHHVLGEGDFVLVVSEGVMSGKPTAFFDMFRVENAKVAEHWNIVEAIPPRREWKNSNGKF